MEALASKALPDFDLSAREIGVTPAMMTDKERKEMLEFILQERGRQSNTGGTCKSIHAHDYISGADGMTHHLEVSRFPKEEPEHGDRFNVSLMTRSGYRPGSVTTYFVFDSTGKIVDTPASYKCERRDDYQPLSAPSLEMGNGLINLFNARIKEHKEAAEPLNTTL